MSWPVGFERGSRTKGSDVFLHLLKEQQKEAFLTLAQRLSMADGEDDPDELAALHDIKLQMNFAGNADMSNVLGDLPLAPFESGRDQSIVLMELLMISYADDYLHQAEAALIGEIAAAFGVDQDRLNVMAEWAMDALDLKRGGDLILDV